MRSSASGISREKKSGTAQSREDQVPVIGHLEFRDKIVTISSSSSGPRYTIATKEGNTVASRLGEQELHAKFPELYQMMKTGEAGNDASF